MRYDALREETLDHTKYKPFTEHASSTARYAIQRTTLHERSRKLKTKGEKHRLSLVLSNIVWYKKKARRNNTITYMGNMILCFVTINGHFKQQRLITQSNNCLRLDNMGS